MKKKKDGKRLHPPVLTYKFMSLLNHNALHLFKASRTSSLNPYKSWKKPCSE